MNAQRAGPPVRTAVTVSEMDVDLMAELRHYLTFQKTNGVIPGEKDMGWCLSEALNHVLKIREKAHNDGKPFDAPEQLPPGAARKSRRTGVELMVAAPTVKVTFKISDLVLRRARGWVWYQKGFTNPPVPAERSLSGLCNTALASFLRRRRNQYNDGKPFEYPSG